MKGEDVVIVHRDKPFAWLVSVRLTQKRREGGRLHGKFRVEDDFYAADPNLDALFNS